MPLTSVEDGKITGKGLFGKRSGPKWAAWYVAHDRLSLDLELKGLRSSV